MLYRAHPHVNSLLYHTVHSSTQRKYFIKKYCRQLSLSTSSNIGRLHPLTWVNTDRRNAPLREDLALCPDRKVLLWQESLALIYICTQRVRPHSNRKASPWQTKFTLAGRIYSDNEDLPLQENLNLSLLFILTENLTLAGGFHPDLHTYT